ncbi:pilus assembly protein PilM [Acetobacterium bakii]|uniref:Pilus assembly protein PilM n=1 Tax=Acetobacterium bakii TaxID=52689 RepID=A0A0L6U3L6_9FIRM|nr:pilus assembly protein PilM [Acetobacterium bakii]KNZ43119.1 hypothetical protein AKG39_02925 [Acetobacterium bakii]
MQTIVYFSNNGIQVLQGGIKSGKLTIRNFKSLPIEEGALINGVITNEEALRTTIAAAMEENGDLFKNISLLIDSSLIMTKNIEVPKLNKKALLALAASEFEDAAGNYENLIVDYSSIPGVNGQNMFCCAVEKNVLDPYVALFESLKVKIKSIDVGLNAIIKYVSGTRDYHGMTFALNLVDGNNLLSLLFENGRYIFSTRSRLMADRGTEAFASELSTRLSSLIQFNKSEKSEHTLVMSLYAGLDEYELNSLKTLVFDPDLKLFIIPQTPNILVTFNVEDTFDFGGYLYPISGFFAGKSDINLMRAYRESNLVKKESNVKYKALYLPIGLAVFFLGAFLTFFILNLRMEKNLEWINQYINDEQVQAEYTQAQTLDAQIAIINEQIASMESINQAIASNPQLVSEKLNRVQTLTNGVIALNTMTYDGTTGALNMTAIANNEQEAALYIERLKATGYFTQIVYGGYSQLEMTRTQTISNTATSSTTSTSQANAATRTTTTTAEGYGFTVDAYLKAGGQ